MANWQRTAITGDQAPQPLGAYSVGMSVSAGKLIYGAGQVGVDFPAPSSGPVMPRPDDYPPNTLLMIDGLVRAEFLVEIKAVAAL